MGVSRDTALYKSVSYSSSISPRVRPAAGWWHLGIRITIGRNVLWDNQHLCSDTVASCNMRSQIDFAVVLYLHHQLLLTKTNTIMAHLSRWSITKILIQRIIIRLLSNDEWHAMQIIDIQWLSVIERYWNIPSGECTTAPMFQEKMICGNLPFPCRVWKKYGHFGPTS